MKPCFTFTGWNWSYNTLIRTFLENRRMTSGGKWQKTRRVVSLSCFTCRRGLWCLRLKVNISRRYAATTQRDGPSAIGNSVKRAPFSRAHWQTTASPLPLVPWWGEYGACVRSQTTANLLPLSSREASTAHACAAKLQRSSSTGRNNYLDTVRLTLD